METTLEDGIQIPAGSFALVFLTGIRPLLELSGNVAFVLNVKSIDSPTGQLEIGPEQTLRRATGEEIEAFKEVAKDYGSPDWSNWEFELSGEKWNRLPQEQLHYFVIAFTGPNKSIVELQRALSIARCQLKIGFTLMSAPFSNVKKTPTLIFEPARLFNLIQANQHQRLIFHEVTAADVEQIRIICNHLRSQPEESEIIRLINQLLSLEALPSQSPLLFLGHFALLESLLTHAPKKTDTIDSITRQIKKKIELLDNRWMPRLDYSPFKTKPGTIWSMMYEYRSCIAHGGEPDFKNSLQVLQSEEQALQLLMQTVKSVIRQALIEPQLIADLRNC